MCTLPLWCNCCKSYIMPIKTWKDPKGPSIHLHWWISRPCMHLSCCKTPVVLQFQAHQWWPSLKICYRFETRPLTLSCEVRVGVKDPCAAVEAAHGGVADGALKDQLRAVGSNCTEQLVHGTSGRGVGAGAVADLVVVRPWQWIRKFMALGSL